MIAVSYLKSIYDTKKTIEMIDNSIADLIHVDLIDGKYTGVNNFQIDEVIDLLKNVNKRIDIHLMVNNPEEYIPKLITIKPEIITIHLNTSSNIKEILTYVKNNNIKVGLAINPDEDIHLIDEYLSNIDYVLIMSVYPGKGGQTFIKDVIKKIDYVKENNKLVGIDGGINSETIDYIKKYNLDIIVSGSYVCLSENFNEQINKLKQ